MFGNVGHQSAQNTSVKLSAGFNADWSVISVHDGDTIRVRQGKNDPVFPNLATGEPMTRDGIAKVVKRCGKLIDVHNLSPHVFRHSHATHAVRRGVPLDLVKDTLGHSSIIFLEGACSGDEFLETIHNLGK